jgi:hypothetical protein
MNLGRYLKHAATGNPAGLMDLFGGGGDNGMNSLFMQMQRQNALRQTQAQGYGLAGLHSINQGYDSAIQGVGAAGEASKLGISQQGAQSRAAIGQNLSSRGLANSTIGANLSGVAGGQTAQALAGVDAAMAQARGGLLTGRAHAQAGAYGNLGNLALGQGASEMALGQMAWNRMASQPSRSQQLAQLMSGVGGLAGMMFGGPMGAMAGSQIGGMMGGGGGGGGMNPMGQMGY